MQPKINRKYFGISLYCYIGNYAGRSFIAVVDNIVNMSMYNNYKKES